MVRSSAAGQSAGGVVSAGRALVRAMRVGLGSPEAADAPDAARPNNPASKLRRAMEGGGVKKGVMGQPHAADV